MKKSKPLILCFLANPLGWKTPGMFGGGEKVTKDYLENIDDFRFLIIQGNRDIFDSKEGIKKEIIKLPIAKTRSTFADVLNSIFWFIFSIKRALKYKNEINLVYAPTSNISDFLPSFIIGKLLRKKIIVKVHITIYKGKSYVPMIIYKNLRREGNSVINSTVRTLSTYFVFLLLNKIDLIIAVSKPVMDDLLLQGIKKKVVVNQNGIVISKRYGHKKIRDYDLCFISRIEKYKGIYEFLEICRRINSSKGIIIGSGSEAEKVSNIIRNDSKLVKRITYLGFLNEERFSYLENSKLFLFATVASEGQAMVIAESMAMGVVTIAYTNKLFKLLYGACKSVILVNDLEEMYSCAKELLNNKAKLTKLSKLALDEATKFDIKKSIIKEKELVWGEIEHWS